MTNLHLVSVIIPVFNAERFVEKAVRSIMTQSYKNLEILICDDCSADESFKILQKLSDEDERIKIFKNEKNFGIVKTLNFLVEKASGKFIARMDADDVSLLFRIEKQVEFLEKNSEISVCGTNAFNIDENDKKIGKSRLPITADDARFFAKYFCPLYHPSVMARAEIFKGNKYSSDFPNAEDYELWVRLVFEKNLKVANLSERLLLYRMTSEQVSAKNRVSQSQAAAKISIKADVLAVDAEFHKNVFYIHEKNQNSPLDELNYAKKQLKEMKGKDKICANATRETIVAHFWKTKKSVLLKLFLSDSLCMGAFCKLMWKNLRGKR